MELTDFERYKFANGKRHKAVIFYLKFFNGHRGKQNADGLGTRPPPPLEQRIKDKTRFIQIETFVFSCDGTTSYIQPITFRPKS